MYIHIYSYIYRYVGISFTCYVVYCFNVNAIIPDKPSTDLVLMDAQNENGKSDLSQNVVQLADVKNGFPGSVKLILGIKKWDDITKVLDDIKTRKLQKRLLKWLRRKTRKPHLKVFIDAYLDVTLDVDMKAGMLFLRGSIHKSLNESPLGHYIPVDVSFDYIYFWLI